MKEGEKNDEEELKKEIGKRETDMVDHQMKSTLHLERLNSKAA